MSQKESGVGFSISRRSVLGEGLVDISSRRNVRASLGKVGRTVVANLHNIINVVAHGHE